MSCIELMNRTENISPWVISLNKALWLQKHDALKQVCRFQDVDGFHLLHLVYINKFLQRAEMNLSVYPLCVRDLHPMALVI